MFVLSQLWSVTAAVFLLVCYTFAANNYARTLWRLHSSCNGQDLDAMVHEASELAAVAIADLDRVIKLPDLDPSMSSDDQGALIRSVVGWGVKVDELGTGKKLADKDLDRLYSAKYQYEIAKQFLDGQNQDSVAYERRAFFCDGSTFQGTTLFDPLTPEPSAQGVKLVDWAQLTDDEFPPFVWYDDELREDDGSAVFYFAPAAGEDINNPPRPCSGSVDLARTVSAREFDIEQTKKFIFFCLGCWDEARFHASLSSFRNIQIQDAFMEGYHGRAGLLLHEMMHWLDANEYDWRIVDIRLKRMSGGTFPAYGLTAIAFLAEKTPGESIYNADNYRMFAELCYMPHIEFDHEKPRPSSKNPTAVKRAPDTSMIQAKVLPHVVQQPMLPQASSTLRLATVPTHVLDPPQQAPPPGGFDAPFDEDADTHLVRKISSIKSLFDKAHATRTSSATGHAST